MQSATSRIRHWKISFDRQGKWRNGLMGWASGGDTLRTPNLKFESKEDAVAYCTRMGWEYEVELPKAKRSFQGEKDYGDNFLTARAKVLTAKRGEAHFDWPHVGKVRCGARRMCNARSPSPRRARAAPPPPSHSLAHRRSLPPLRRSSIVGFVATSGFTAVGGNWRGVVEGMINHHSSSHRRCSNQKLVVSTCKKYSMRTLLVPF